MTCGPARQLVSEFAQRPGDVILLTSPGEPGSLTRHLWNEYNSRQKPAAQFGKGKVGEMLNLAELQRKDALDPLPLELKSKVKLKDEELQLYNDAIEAAKEKAAQRRALMARSRRRLEADEEEGEDDDDSDADDDAAEDNFGEFGNVADPVTRKRGYGAAFGDDAGDRGAAADGTEISYDVFLRGNAAKVTSFFGARGDQKEADAAAGDAGIRFRMFPFLEKRRRIDTFGEAVDVNRWLDKKNELEQKEKLENEQNETNATLQRAQWQMKKAKEAPPSKFIVENVRIEFKCQLAYVDLESVADGRALKTLLPQLHPRRLVMVNAARQARHDTRDALLSVKSMTKEIWCPITCFSVAVGESTIAMTVNLDDGLIQHMKLSQFEDFEVAYLRSTFKISDQSSLPTLAEASMPTSAKIEEIVEEEEEAENNDGEEAEDGEVKAKPPQPVKVDKKTVLPTIFIGDLKLSNLKAHLGRSQVPADFAGEGLLVCGLKPNRSNQSSAIAVQKEGEGKIVIEGNLGQSFFDVRDHIYGLHAHIEG